MIARAAPPRLPPLPAPPHDPRWLRLDARAGWRAARLDGVVAAARCRTLQLAPHPLARRSLAEADGGFGGLVPPANVAIAGDGSPYLLDLRARRLRRLDPCACAFETVPCFGGAGDDPRRLHDPRAIAIHGGDLYVCDAGGDEPAGAAGEPRRSRPRGGRVTVWALPAMALRSVWMLPTDPPSRPLAWRPVALAHDGRGRVWVADAANGMLHRFDRAGRLRQSVAGLGGVRHLAIDGRDRLYVVIDGIDRVQVLDEEGRFLAPMPDDPEPLRPFFPPPPFRVHAGGVLDLRTLCEAAGGLEPAPAGQRCAPRNDALPRSTGDEGCRPGALQPSGFFDLYGAPVPAPAPSSDPRFLPAGEYLSEPLDSRLHRCQWHRVVVAGEVPPGTRLDVATYTAEAPQPASHVEALPDDAWSVLPPVTGVRDEWDALVRSATGRYLWLRLRFAGDGGSTAGVRSVRIEFPRISLRRYLPAVWGEEPLAADFADRFLAVFDTTLRGIEQRLDGQAELYDPLSAPAARDPRGGPDFLAWLASWIGVTLDRQWPERTRREYLKQAARGFDLRGTPAALRAQLLHLLGMDAGAVRCPGDQPRTRCTPRPAGCRPPERPPRAWQPPPLILEHYKLRRWLFLGAGRLGDQAVLWGQRIVNRSQLLGRDSPESAARVGETQLVTTPDPLRDPFHVYAHRFSVFLPASCARSPERRRALENLVAGEKPAHTAAQIVYVEPRFRIGFQSMIGLDSVVGRYPEGVALGGTPLGAASVLGGGPAARGAPTLRVGASARVGTTTVLD